MAEEHSCTPALPLISRGRQDEEEKEEEDTEDEEEKHLPRPLLCASCRSKLLACVISCTAHKIPRSPSCYKLKSLTQSHTVHFNLSLSYSRAQASNLCGLSWNRNVPILSRRSMRRAREIQDWVIRRQAIIYPFFWLQKFFKVALAPKFPHSW